MFLKTVKQVKLEVRPLFLPQLVQLTSLLKPGLTRIRVRNWAKHFIMKFTYFLLHSCCFPQWTNPRWVEFYEKCKNAIETFNVLVIRVHDIYANRILNVLTAMHDVSLQNLPTGDELWTIEEFLEKNEESCRFVENTKLNEKV